MDQEAPPAGSDGSPDKGEGRREGPDPAIGAGIALLGIFVMGTGGARDAHFVFDAGAALAVIGAATFVGSVALSALKQRQAKTPDA